MGLSMKTGMNIFQITFNDFRERNDKFDIQSQLFSFLLIIFTQRFFDEII